jgi:hypothetical protein
MELDANDIPQKVETFTDGKSGHTRRIIGIQILSETQINLATFNLVTSNIQIFKVDFQTQVTI